MLRWQSESRKPLSIVTIFLFGLLGIATVSAEDIQILFSLVNRSDSISDLGSGGRFPVDINMQAKGEEFAITIPEGNFYARIKSQRANEVATEAGLVHTDTFWGQLISASDLVSGDFIVTWADNGLGSFGFNAWFDLKSGESYRISSGAKSPLSIYRYSADLGRACAAVSSSGEESRNRPRTRLQLSDQRSQSRSDNGGNSTAQGEEILDLVVAYTDCALKDYNFDLSGLVADITGAVSDANYAYAQSQLHQHLQLVAVVPTDEAEDCNVSSPNWEGRDNSMSKLTALGRAWDGKWDDVLLARERYGADLLSLLIVDSSAIHSEGDRPIAFSPHLAWPNEWDHHLSLMGNEYLVSHYLAHEIGHNMGAGHEIGNPSGDSPGAFEYSHGHQWNFDGQCRASVMSYGTGCPIYPAPNWTRYFSNPLVNDSEEENCPTGIANVADNAKTLTLTSGVVSGFRQRAELPSKLINGTFNVDLGYDTNRDSTWDDALANNNRPDGWGQSGAWPGYIDTLVKFQHSASVKLTRTYNPNDTYYRPYVYQDIPVVQGKTYVVEGDIKTACQDSNCFGTIVTECMADHDTHIWGNSCGLNNWLPGKYPPRVTGNTDWVKIGLQVTASRSDAKFLRVICYNSAYQQGVPAGIGTVWCADMTVSELTENDDGGGHPEPSDEDNHKKQRYTHYGG